jgi:hypothetical protein
MVNCSRKKDFVTTKPEVPDSIQNLANKSKVIPGLNNLSTAP